MDLARRQHQQQQQRPWNNSYTKGDDRDVSLAKDLLLWPVDMCVPHVFSARNVTPRLIVQVRSIDVDTSVTNMITLSCDRILLEWHDVGKINPWEPMNVRECAPEFTSDKDLQAAVVRPIAAIEAALKIRDGAVILTDFHGAMAALTFGIMYTLQTNRTTTLRGLVEACRGQRKLPGPLRLFPDLRRWERLVRNAISMTTDELLTMYGLGWGCSCDACSMPARYRCTCKQAFRCGTEHCPIGQNFGEHRCTPITDVRDPRFFL